jgi:DNA-binding transcriptional regulator YiaG
MQLDQHDLPALFKEVRKQLALSQEGLARELGVSFGTVNRWENAKVRPSQLAKAQFEAFCSKMIKQGKLKL